ncbi:MAG: hypothetical protein DWQ49_09980 [Bacteroidetes bacterium]|nr:MAG: hypothetical protein DWQ49_09980 [Bacteroidota bacterium]
MNANVKLESLNDYIVSYEDELLHRELELDRRLLNSAVGISQRVEVELIKRLRITAPWLIPMIINK